MNEIQLWTLKSRSPVEVATRLTKTFAPSGMNSNVSDNISSVAFNCENTAVYGGSFRGLIHVCDVHSGKSNSIMNEY